MCRTSYDVERSTDPILSSDPVLEVDSAKTLSCNFMVLEVGIWPCSAVEGLVFRVPLCEGALDYDGSSGA